MTEAEARDLAARALPCPFCGERLIVEENPDFRGILWRLRHPKTQIYCLFVWWKLLVLDGPREIDRWNTRTVVQVESKTNGDQTDGNAT